jgi:cell division protein FtsB
MLLLVVYLHAFVIFVGSATWGSGVKYDVKQLQQEVKRAQSRLELLRQELNQMDDEMRHTNQGLQALSLYG